MRRSGPAGKVGVEVRLKPMTVIHFTGYVADFVDETEKITGSCLVAETDRASREGWNGQDNESPYLAASLGEMDKAIAVVNETQRGLRKTADLGFVVVCVAGTPLPCHHRGMNV